MFKIAPKIYFFVQISSKIDFKVFFTKKFDFDLGWKIITRNQAVPDEMASQLDVCYILVTKTFRF